MQGIAVTATETAHRVDKSTHPQEAFVFVREKVNKMMEAYCVRHWELSRRGRPSKGLGGMGLPFGVLFVLM